MLKLVLRASQLIALLTALFLLSANLDNVPDSPELLTASSGSTILVHHAPSKYFEAVQQAWDGLRPLDIGPYELIEATVVSSPASCMACLNYAADPSPSRHAHSLIAPEVEKLAEE